MTVEKCEIEITSHNISTVTVDICAWFLVLTERCIEKDVGLISDDLSE